MMTKTTRKNATVKAFQTELTNREKKCNSQYYRIERKFIGAVNNRGENLTCEQVKDFCERYCNKIGEGLSKIAFGMDDVVICFNKHNIVNQVKNQVDFWNKIALTDDADYFNPVLSYGLHRGYKLTKQDPRYIDKSFLVSQRAQTFATLDEAVRKMYTLNNKPFDNKTVDYYKTTLQDAAARYNIQDLHNGNFGMIYVYYKFEYRVVVLDYAI